MSSSDSDSESDVARKAKLAFALWEPPVVEKPRVEAKPVVVKPVVVGFQQPDFRDIPKSLDTLMGEELERVPKEDVFGASFVLSEQAMTTKVTRDDFYRRYKDLSILGLRMSAKEREEHVLAQHKGARMLDKSLAEQFEFCDVSEPSDSDLNTGDDDNGGIQMFCGTKTRITEVQAPETPKIGLVGGTSRPAAWNIKRSARIASDDDSDSDSEESRKRKVALAGVVVDFTSSSGFSAPTPSNPSKSHSTAMDGIVPASPPAQSDQDNLKDKKREKKHKDKKEKHKKHKKEKESKKSKKRKREATNSDEDGSLG